MNSDSTPQATIICIYCHKKRTPAMTFVYKGGEDGAIDSICWDCLFPHVVPSVGTQK